jgi:hypothetical protein
MTAKVATAIQLPTFTHLEWCALRAFRARHQQDAGPFGDREPAHLRFLRWLSWAGQLAS